jgi:tetratricopeptide (TPR) repeat protein
MTQKSMYNVIRLVAVVIVLILPEHRSYAQRAFGQLVTWSGGATVNIPSVPEPTCEGCPSSGGNNGGRTSGTNTSSSTTYQMTAADYNNQYSSFINEQGNKENDKGVESFKDGDYRKALRQFRRALKYLPNSSTIKQNIANAEDRLDEAKREKERVAERAKEEEAIRKLNEENRKANEKYQQEVERHNRDVAEKEISAAIEEIGKTKQQITSIQLQLKMYSKDLKNNEAEFEKWAKTADDAFQNTLKVSKEYSLQMFIKYGLMNALKPEVKIAYFNKFGKFLASADPEIQKWVLTQVTSNGVRVDIMQDVINYVNLGKDMAGLLVGSPNQVKENLNALLFINSFFETTKMVDYKGLMGKFFPGTPGSFFTQAKLIGEVYSDLAVNLCSWYTMNRVEDNNNEIAEKIRSLSYSMESQQHKMDCLHTCLENAVKSEGSPYCVNGCSGKTRFTSPVPPLP